MLLFDGIFFVIIETRKPAEGAAEGDRMKQYLAVDIGASSGRHIVGRREGDKLVTEEVYRFPNGAKTENGRLVWDVRRLLEEVRRGMRAAVEKCGKLDSFSIDTWAVDYVLMDGDKEIFPCHAYRDGRTERAVEEVHAVVPFAELYARTGFQFQPFNTVYQLYADKLEGRLERADGFLMLPEYLLYKLTGVRSCEYTNATSTGLVNAGTHGFDAEIVAALGLPARLFEKEIRQPCAAAGRLLPAVAAELGCDMRAVLCATHDTASAVIAAPVACDFDSPYISSGTWSLLGIEQERAHTGEYSRGENFSNEGGPNFTFRWQKNIMGLWMLQSARRELGLDFAAAEKLARENPCDAVVDCNDGIFLAPPSMCAAVRERAGNLSDGQLLYCIYNSLARCYKGALGAMGEYLGKKFTTLNIIGGGSNDSFLNELTAKTAKVSVIAGPSEATALGNLLVQMIAGGEICDIRAGRELVKKSFPLRVFQ